MLKPQHCRVLAVDQSIELGNSTSLREFRQHSKEKTAQPLTLMAIRNGDRNLSTMPLIGQPYISGVTNRFLYGSISKQSSDRDVVRLVCGCEPVQFFLCEGLARPQKP